MDDNNTTVPYGGSQRGPKAFRNGGSESVLSWQKEGFQRDLRKKLTDQSEAMQVRMGL